MVLSSSSVVFAVITLAATALGQQNFESYRDFIVDPVPAVTQTVTFTVFGPVSTITENLVVTRTQMYNGGITSDVQITETTSSTKTFYDDKTEWNIEGAQVQTSATVTATSVSMEVLNEINTPTLQVSTLRPIFTQIEYAKENVVSTVTAFAKSTIQEVSVVLIPMTTTLYQTVTRTHVAVQSQVVTSTRAGFIQPPPQAPAQAQAQPLGGY